MLYSRNTVHTWGNPWEASIHPAMVYLKRLAPVTGEHPPGGTIVYTGNVHITAYGGIYQRSGGRPSLPLSAGSNRMSTTSGVRAAVEPPHPSAYSGGANPLGHPHGSPLRRWQASVTSHLASCHRRLSAPLKAQTSCR